VKTKNLTETS